MWPVLKANGQILELCEDFQALRDRESFVFGDDKDRGHDDNWQHPDHDDYDANSTVCVDRASPYRLVNDVVAVYADRRQCHDADTKWKTLTQFNYIGYNNYELYFETFFYLD